MVEYGRFDDFGPKVGAGANAQVGGGGPGGQPAVPALYPIAANYPFCGLGKFYRLGARGPAARLIRSPVPEPDKRST